MIDRTDGARWLGLLPALGVLLVLLVWYAVRNARGRARDVATIWGAVHFLVAAAGGISGALYLGMLAFAPDGRGLFGGDPQLRWLAVVLALVGTGVGLFVATSSEPATPEARVPGDEPLPVEPARPAVSARTALAAIVAMAVPVATTPFLAPYSRATTTGWSEAELVVAGVLVGAALLYVVLVAEVAWAPVAFLLVATGKGLALMFARTFFEELWFMFASGLIAGLLVPSGLRLLRHTVADDQGTLVRGVLLALLLLAAASGLAVRARF